MEEEMSYGTTTHYQLPYPNDYTDLADVPLVVQALAEKVDTELYSIVGNISSVLDQINGEVI